MLADDVDVGKRVLLAETLRALEEEVLAVAHIVASAEGVRVPEEVAQSENIVDGEKLADKLRALEGVSVRDWLVEVVRV